MVFSLYSSFISVSHMETGDVIAGAGAAITDQEVTWKERHMMEEKRKFASVPEDS